MPTLKDKFWDILFPRHCLGCHSLLEDKTQSYVCPGCLTAIPLASGFACAFCSSPVKAGRTCVYCIKNHFLDRLLAATSYENHLVETVLKTTKYRFVRSLTADIATLMIKYLQKKVPDLSNNTSITLVPVPLHRLRLNWRGFNQAEMIAAKISEYFGWPSTPVCLRRVRNHQPQAEIKDRASRIENMRDTFEYNNSAYQGVLANKTVVLVDDVSTTGSTLDDCARALKGAGAKEVTGFVFARGKI